MSQIAAVLWDLDGTLVDTEPLWIEAERELATSHGKFWSEADGLALVGNSLIESGRYIQNRLELDMTPEEIVDYLVVRLAAKTQGPIDWRPGARELIAALHARGVPLALVTMSYRPIAAPIAAQFPFDAVVTGDAVTHGKPDPEPYLRAAELLGVEPEECVAIEDSDTGADSANAAGCHVVAVPHLVTITPAPRRTLVATLAGLSPDDLFELTKD